MIHISNLTLKVANKILMQNFSASISKGECIGIFGKNGAGKSTFLKALLGLVPPAQGHISIVEKTVLGYLPQTFDSLTLDYSVAGFLQLFIRAEQYGLPVLRYADHQYCDDALSQVQALHLKHRLLKQLSGGELKRIMLASLLLNHPQILLLDEPFANLDLHYQKEILKLLRDLQKNLQLTLLITAHDFNTLRDFLERVVFISEERVILEPVAKYVNFGVIA